MINIHNTGPTKFSLRDSNSYQYSINDSSSCGPCFGGGMDIRIIESDFQNNDSSTSYPHSYSDTLGKGKSIFTGDFNNNNEKFRLKELEVFKLNK